MNKLKILLMAPALTLVAGCAANQVDATYEDDSIVEFSERLVKSMSSNIDKLVIPLIAEKKETDNYRSYHNSFFPVVGGQQGVLSSLSSYCVKAGGSFRQGACENTYGDLLFYAKVQYTGTYGKNRETTLTVVEPVSGNNSVFMLKARELGYTTEEEQFAKRQRAAEKAKILRDQAKRQYETEQMLKDQEAQRILDAGRGTKVCKVEGEYVSVGFVNDFSGQNIQIQVQTIHLKGALGIRPGGFQPHTTWGQARDWHLCQ